ncbi:hypothetical protein YC2023_035416 [Brassica napus]
MSYATHVFTTGESQTKLRYHILLQLQTLEEKERDEREEARFETDKAIVAGGNSHEEEDNVFLSKRNRIPSPPNAKPPHHGLDYAFTVSMIKDNVIDEIMKGLIYANEIKVPRLKSLTANLHPWGFAIIMEERVSLDAPCSGTGPKFLNLTICMGALAPFTIVPSPCPWLSPGSL